MNYLQISVSKNSYSIWDPPSKIQELGSGPSGGSYFFSEFADPENLKTSMAERDPGKGLSAAP
jgi:hypothetical protein